MYSIAFTLTLAFIVGNGASGSPVKNPQDISYPEQLHHIGSTATKEFYITKAEIDSLMVDFAHALKHVCTNYFQMSLASVESEEEFAVINNWLTTEFDNSTSSPKAWTSGLEFGSMGKRWASTGTEFNLSTVIAGPWPAGAGSSPAYSWNTCLSVFKNCNTPRGAPPGCFPLRTEFFYDDCRVKRQVICQRTRQ
ncbi:unnamed protein product [Allacma fusca]|uniref:Uncharacterized protein n=1 Tax=Allacma fusca TaxID=39272 RepID=A0A8J2LTL4_9HEXA|nr:unnamed protein product [Allacma fusca]